MYKINAKSSDGQGYECVLDCNEINIYEEFKKQIDKKGWGHYQYKIVAYTEIVKTENDTNK